MRNNKENQTIKIDLHCHTEASSDCTTPLELIPERCQKQDIAVLAITDHNTIKGAQELQKIANKSKNTLVNIIVGEEITTTDGEIIGLFLKEEIPAGLSAYKTIEYIKAQNGLVFLPHGLDPLKRFRLKPHIREDMKDYIDIVETFNARISFQRYNLAARKWAATHEKAMAAGSDAHTLRDIGSAWVEVPKQPIDTPKDLLAALTDRMPTGTWTHPALAYIYKMITWKR